MPPRVDKVKDIAAVIPAVALRRRNSMQVCARPLGRAEDYVTGIAADELATFRAVACATVTAAEKKKRDADAAAAATAASSFPSALLRRRPLSASTSSPRQQQQTAAAAPPKEVAAVAEPLVPVTSLSVAELTSMLPKMRRRKRQGPRSLRGRSLGDDPNDGGEQEEEELIADGILDGCAETPSATASDEDDADADDGFRFSPAAPMRTPSKPKMSPAATAVARANEERDALVTLPDGTQLRRIAFVRPPPRPPPYVPVVASRDAPPESGRFTPDGGFYVSPRVEADVHSTRSRVQTAASATTSPRRQRSPRPPPPSSSHGGLSGRLSRPLHIPSVRVASAAELRGPPSTVRRTAAAMATMSARLPRTHRRAAVRVWIPKMPGDEAFAARSVLRRYAQELPSEALLVASLSGVEFGLRGQRVDVTVTYSYGEVCDELAADAAAVAAERGAAKEHVGDEARRKALPPPLAPERRASLVSLEATFRAIVRQSLHVDNARFRGGFLVCVADRATCGFVRDFVSLLISAEHPALAAHFFDVQSSGNAADVGATAAGDVDAAAVVGESPLERVEPW